MAEQVVVGSSMAALVAADRLAAAGHHVRLLLSPGPLGGGFGSLERDGRVLEFGVRFLELDYEGTPQSAPPLDAYTPGVAGHRAFAALVRDYVEGLVGDRLDEVGRPRMLVDGRMHDDLYFTTDASVIRDVLGTAARHAVARQARACEDEAGDPAGVLADEHRDAFAAMTLTTASLANHGCVFHERFVAPVAEKFVAGGGDDVLAAFRRKIWLPLFWPRTLAQAAGTAPVAFTPRRPLHTVRDGGAGQVVTAVHARLAAAAERGAVFLEQHGALARIEPGPGGRVTLAMADGTTVEATRPVLGAAPTELFAAAGLEYRPAKARTAVSWIEVADEDLGDLPSLVNVVDADVPACRISTGGTGAPGHRLFTVELAHDTPETQLAEAARKSLEVAGVVRAGALMAEIRSAAVPSFALPSPANAERFAAVAARYAEQGLDACVVGGAAAFGADALGEQIVQGLRAAADRA